MPIEHILGLLTAERDRLNRAIQALQGMEKGRGRSAAGRAATAAVAPKKKRRRMSAAARKAQAERMRAFWAAKRKQKAKQAG